MLSFVNTLFSGPRFTLHSTCCLWGSEIFSMHVIRLKGIVQLLAAAKSVFILWLLPKLVAADHELTHRRGAQMPKALSNTSKNIMRSPKRWWAA